MKTEPRTLARFGEVAIIFVFLSVALLATIDVAASLMGMRIP